MPKLIAKQFSAGLGLLVALATSAHAQQQDTYDYWQPQRDMISRGQQAIFMCNGLFTSKRTLEQVFADELAFLPNPIGTADGGDYNVDWDLKAVEIGAPVAVPTMRAVFREGNGCIILPPDQSFADIDRLPELTLPYPPGNPASIPWPDGDPVELKPLRRQHRDALRDQPPHRATQRRIRRNRRRKTR